MIQFSLQIIREQFAAALERPCRAIRFAESVPEGETLLVRRGKSGFFLDNADGAVIVPAGTGCREVADSIFVSFSEKCITLTRFGKRTEEAELEPDAWYRTREEAGPVLEELFHSLCRLEPDSRAVPSLLRSICELVAERLENEIEQQLSGEEQLWFRIRDRIGRCFREDLSREAIAEMLRIHPARLSRLVRKFAGTGVCDYVRDLRLGCAEELLMAKEVIPIEDISRRCGFNSASYFISIFRRKYGISPGAFRRRHLDL